MFNPEVVEYTLVAALVSGLIAFLIEVIPGFNAVWHEKLSSEMRSLVTLFLFLGVPAAGLLSACGGLDLGFGVVCDTGITAQSIYNALASGVLAYLASQIAHGYGKSKVG